MKVVTSAGGSRGNMRERIEKGCVRLSRGERILFQVQNSFSADLPPRQNIHWSKTISWWLGHFGVGKPVV